MATVIGCSAFITTAASARDARVGGRCPHTSSVLKNPGSFTITLAPNFSKNSNVCLSSRIKVRAKNGVGYPRGWRTVTFVGDPGIFKTAFADDVAWTNHDVLIAGKQGNYWGGITIRP